MKIVKVVY